MGWIAAILCLLGYCAMARSAAIGFAVSGVGSTLWVLLGVSRGSFDFALMQLCFAVLSVFGCWVCCKKGLPRELALPSMEIESEEV